MSSRPTRPPGCCSALDHGDGAAAAGEVQRGRQAGQSGADHDHSLGVSPTVRMRHHAARSVQAVAISAKAVRTTGRMWLVSTSVNACVSRASINRSIQSTAPVAAIKSRQRRTSLSSRSSALISSRELTAQRGVGEMIGGDHDAGGFVFREIAAGWFAGNRR